MAKINEDDINALREKANIVDVISGYTALKKSGPHTFKGLCPFHSEKTPSFQVDITKGLFHCFAAETEVITYEGTFPISKLAGQSHMLLSTNGQWVEGEVKSFGEQQLWAVHVSRNRVRKTIYATDEHRWFVRCGKNLYSTKEVLTKHLHDGQYLASTFPSSGNLLRTGPAGFGVAHGFTFGDGYRTPYGCTAAFHGEKDRHLLKYFPECDIWTGGGVVRAGRLPMAFKEFPSLWEAPGYLLGWLAGYFAADGCVDKAGHATLASAKRENLEFVRHLALRLGIGTYGIKVQSRRGFGTVDSDLYSVAFMDSTLHPSFFVVPKHRERYERAMERGRVERPGWRVRSVEPTDRVEEVFCAVVPGTHAFALADNILTGNCFGCSEGGNLYQFVQKIENLPFPEAVEWLAKREGFNLRYEEARPGERAGANARARIIAANEAATAFFHKTLMESPDAVEARNYLGGRGFKREVAERWKLGYAPGRDALYKHLTSKGFTADELIKADLARKSDRDGGMYDTFRQRITFPTWNIQGDVVGFGARAMGEQQPKYLNSAETPAFSKSRVMYGLDRAKSAISRGVAVVVEGYTDVIALHEAGITEAVATNGVALGESHFEMLKKFTQRVVLMLDADSAGRGATERSFEIQHRVGVDILVAVLPAGGDPADVVKEDGPDGIRKAIGEAQPLLQFKLEESLAKIPLDTPEARARAVREAARVLGSHPDPIARSDYVFMAAERIGVDVSSVERALTEVRTGGAEDTSANVKMYEDRRLPGQVKVEREALQLLLDRHTETVPWLESMADDEFTSRARRELFTAIRDARLASGNVSPAALVERLSPDAATLLTELSVGEAMPDQMPEEGVQERIDEVFTRLRVFRLERHIKSRRETLQQVNPLDDAAKHDSLFTELVGLEAERRDLLRRLQGAA